MAERVLAVFAHPDDETLACGGTLAKHVAAGDVVSVAVVTDGVSSRTDAFDAARNVRALAFASAMKTVGAGTWYQGMRGAEAFDNRLDRLALLDIAQWIEMCVAAAQPTIVYTHHRGDLNIDHQIVAEAALVATRPQPGGSVKAVYAGEVLSSTEWAFDGSFVPNLFVNMTPFMPKKLEAMKCYSEELRDWPHPRSEQGVIGLAMARGMAAGARFAEAFQVIREIR